MKPGVARQREDKHGRLVVAALLALHAGLLAWSALRHSPTVDEPHHLASGISYLQFGRFDLNRGNPPLTGFAAAWPVLLASPRTDWSHFPHTYSVCVDFLAANGLRSCWLTTLARWACISFSLLGGYICYRWAAELYGHASGIVALLLWCFSPNILAHGQLITGDMPATAVGVAAFYVFWRWLSRPSLRRAVLTGLLLGLAELTKYVWVLLYLLWPVFWVTWRLLGRRDVARPSFLREAGYLAIIVLLSVYVINLGYGFERPFQPLERFDVGRRMLEQMEALFPTEGQFVAAGVAGWASSVPVPLPENYVLGVDEILQHRDTKPSSYLRREWRQGGFWYFYPYALLVKMPLGTLTLLVVACVASVWLPSYRAKWKTELLLLLSIAAVLCFATCSGTSQSMRYVLPVLPLTFVWASKIGRVFVQKRRAPMILVGGCVGWSIVSSLSIYPHSLAYFNEAAGGPTRGHAHLVFDHIDWGQDFLYLKRWLDKHPEASPIGLSWHHPLLDPRVLELEYTEVPPGPVRGRRYSRAQLMTKVGPQPGWHAVNVTRLHDQSRNFAYFLSFKPVARAGYSIYIYHVTPDGANKVRRELGLPEL